MPDRCEKCNGQLFNEGNDVVCLSCGWRRNNQIIPNACKYCGGDVLQNYKHTTGLFKCCGCSRILNKGEVNGLKRVTRLKDFYPMATRTGRNGRKDT